MSGSGYAFKDAGISPPPVEDIPAFIYSESYDEVGAIALDQLVETRREEQPQPESSQSFIEDQTAQLRTNFTATSHELAHTPLDSDSAIQIHPDDEDTSTTRDIGWHRPTVEIPDPLIAGLPNGQLFSMIRRFNKDVFAVKSASVHFANGLDLSETWSDEFVSDKVALNLQRFYLGIVLQVTSLSNQVSRLRSWKETPRTSAFLLVYLGAWLSDLLMPLIFGTVILLVSFPDIRNVLFPPAPRALVSLDTGGLQRPPAGQLATVDTLTGAPEKQQGEAAQEEASNFVKNLRHLVQRAIGMHNGPGHDGDPLEGKVPKTVRKAVRVLQATGSAMGHVEDNKDIEQTEEPMEELLWSRLKPEVLNPAIKSIPHGLGEIMDNWERFANTLSPTFPFSQYSFIRLDVVLLPLFIVSLFVSSYIVHKVTGLAIGFGIFGDPVITQILEWLNQNFPNWKSFLQPKNNILRGVPTNSQLTITLLRIGEAHNSPLPPVPTSHELEANRALDITIDDIPLGTTEADKLDIINPPLISVASTLENTDVITKRKRISKLTKFFKINTKAVVKTKLALDHVSAAAGSKNAKGRLGVLPKSKELVYAGPSYFKARLDGKNGWLYVTTASIPSLVFTKTYPQAESVLQPMLEIHIDEITTLKRTTAFTAMGAETITKWSTSGERELLGSVEVGVISHDDDRVNITVWKFTALPERDELFNRLIAIGSQCWEIL